MNRPHLLSLFLLFASIGLASTADTIADLRRIDDARQQALIAGDVVALRELFHPDCVYTHGSGRVQSGDDYVALLERGDLRYLAMRYEFPPVVRLQGSDTAVVSGRLRLTGQGRSGPANERIMAVTAVYARQDSRWQLVSYQSTPTPAAPAVEILAQKPVIDNVCAWPKLILLPDGTIVAALYDQPSHGLMPGDVACWASTDGGLTWEHRGNATRHEGNSAWFNHALGVTANGDLIVVTSGWDYQEAGGKQNVPLVPIATRSSDGGRTWTTIGRFPAAPEAGKAFVPFGNIELGSDGRLRVAAYSYARGLPPPRTDVGYVIASADAGVTWTIDAVIGQPEVNETDLFNAGNGRWLAAARNLQTLNGRGAHSIDLYISDDEAKTWRRHGRVTQPDSHPGDLLKLADGRILLTYGDRRGPTYGVNGMISADGGLTWSPEFALATGLDSRDSGYPSSVQLADGTIVTAYYAHGASDYPGYHLGVVRWRLK